MRRGLLVIVSLQAAFVQATMVAVRLMAGYRALELGADVAGVATIASAFAVPALLAAFVLGRLSDRTGGGAIATVGVLLNVAGILVALLVHDFTLLLIACALGGLGHVAALVGQQSFVAHHADPSRTDGIFGTITATGSMGQLAGPALAGAAASVGLLGTQGASAGLLVALLFAALTLPVCVPLVVADLRLRRRLHADPEDEASGTALPSRSQLWRALAVSGLVLASIDLLYSFLPLWGQERGVSAAAVGGLLAVRAGVAVLCRFGLTSLVRRFGRKALLVVSVGSAAVALAALPFVEIVGAVAVMVVLGVGLSIPQPLTVSWLIAGRPRAARGRLVGLRMTANRLAQSAIPVTVGAVAAPAGTLGVFGATAVLLGLASLATATTEVPDPPAPAADASGDLP